MAKEELSALKVGIIAGTISTVVGGTILAVIPGLRKASWNAVVWGWTSSVNVSVWVWKMVVGEYVIKGWYLGALGFLAMVGGLHLFFRLRPQAEVSDGPDYLRYTEDTIHNVKWRWRYSGSQIDNLWCFCPRCDAHLVYNDRGGFYFGEEPKTDFICENCDQVLASIKGGDKDYAIAAVSREISRRFRTGEYKRALPPASSQNGR